MGSADVPSKYFTVQADDKTNTSKLTISTEYLDTLGEGAHTLTARFGGGVTVDFQIQDAPPDHFILQPTDFTVKGSNLQAAFAVAVPEGLGGTATLVTAVYQNGQLKDAVLQSKTLTPGRNYLSPMTVPYSVYTYRVFLMDGQYRPLTEVTAFRAEDFA